MPAVRWAMTVAASVGLAACGAQGSNPAEAAEAAEAATGAGTAAPSAAASPDDTGAIMKAAGYRRAGSTWQTDCDDPDFPYEGSIEQRADLNGDGAPEAVVAGGNTACFGNTGTGFKVLTRKGATWTVLVDEPGIPTFFKRPNIAWPDIEVGGPGTACMRFLRWNGSAYVAGGTSRNGKICDLAPAFAQTVKDDAFPIKTGFYTYPELTCAQAMGNPPSGVTITRKFWRDIDADYDILPVKKLGEGRYRMGDYAIRILSGDEFIADEGTDAEVRLRWCTAKEL